MASIPISIDSSAATMPEGTRNICDLPYDVLFELFGYLSAVDITSLLSTCRNLQRHTKDPSIWQRLASRYGLRNATRFDGLSFYTVYTQLLHPYGELLGLWASDHPYRGNIIEFRLIQGDEHEQGGIIGEVWRFAAGADGSPTFPEYVRALKISFEGPPLWLATSAPTRSPRSSPGDSTAKTHIQCSTISPTDATHWHSTYLEVVPPSHFGHFLQGYRRTYTHPDLPGENALWYDRSRGLPRLKPSSPILVDQRELVRIYPAVRLPIIFNSATSRTKPSAISIHCSSGDERCTQFHQPTLLFDDLSTAPPRYYPLQRDIQVGVDLDSPDFSLETFAGLWLGWFGHQHGTEVLHLTWREDLEELRAEKLTGDTSVPRGSHSWTLYASSRSPPPGIPATWDRRFPVPRLVYGGVGTISERGFPMELNVELIIGIADANTIQIFWDQMNDTRIYERYTGREDLA